jgi:hypothetical protein
MNPQLAGLRAFAFCAVLGALAGCGSKEPPAPAPSPPAPVASTDAAAPADAPAPVTADQVARTWTPEALEELLAPVALYPDPVLSQLLIASTNPQEVLDAGNWLLQNQGVKGKALDEAAAAVGFTPPIRALVQFPETVDMMCLELGWTTELGEAFVADQPGVLGAVQRLRTQAIEVGNLQSSPQMQVVTEQQEGQDVVVLKPAKPEVVYVPQYDPVTAYAPLPATTSTTAVPATTPVEAQKSGHSTGAMITTGVLAFGAGILVNELFDDDDHHKNKYDYYYPNYGYGGMPYYPPYPYRPAYGGGFRPGYGYNRPPNYNSGFVNTGNIVINTGGGNRPGNNYWDRYDDKRPLARDQRPTKVSSPITAAKPNRPELKELDKRQARPMPADVKRPSPDRSAKDWKGQGSYAGARDRKAETPQDRIANAQPGYSRPAAAKPGDRSLPKAQPKVQGTYAGGKYDRPTKAQTAARPGDRPLPMPKTRDVAKPQSREAAQPQSRDLPKPQTRDVQRPDKGPVDRGYGKQPSGMKPAAKPQQQAARPTPVNKAPTAVSPHSGKADRAASQRGKQSLPQGARSKGGGKKNKR